MLTFGHPESSSTLLGVRLDAGKAYGHSHSAFLRNKCIHLATQRALAHFWASGWTRGGPTATRTMPFCLINAYIWPPREPWRTFSVRLDAGRAFGYSNSAFLPYKCLHVATPALQLASSPAIQHSSSLQLSSSPALQLSSSPAALQLCRLPAIQHSESRPALQQLSSALPPSSYPAFREPSESWTRGG